MKLKKVAAVLSTLLLSVNFDCVMATKGKLNKKCLQKVCDYLYRTDEMTLWRAVQKNTSVLTDKNFVLNLPKNITWRMLMDVQYQCDDIGMYALDKPSSCRKLGVRAPEKGYIDALLKAWSHMTTSIQECRKMNADLYIELHDLAVDNVWQNYETHHYTLSKTFPVDWRVVRKEPSYVLVHEPIYMSKGIRDSYIQVSFGLSTAKEQKPGNFTKLGLEEFDKKQTENNWFDGLESKLLEGSSIQCNNLVAEEIESKEKMKDLIDQFFAQYYKSLDILNSGQSLEGSFLPEHSSPLDKKLELIIRTCQDLDQAHVFADGNIRTIAFLVMNKMLIENDLNPTCMYDPNVLDCTDIKTLIEHVKTGQAYFLSLKNRLNLIH